MSQAMSERERLRSLRDYDVLDTPPEAAFDAIADLAARLCEAPIALVSLVDECRQWFKAKVGLEAPETPRDVSFCAHAIEEELEESERPRLFVVSDALLDARFRDNPLVLGPPHIRFYAGARLVAPDGAALGTLCVIDRRPRVLSELQADALRVLAAQVVAQLELRRVGNVLREREQRLRRLFSSTGEAIFAVDLGGRCTAANPALASALALGSPEAPVGEPLLARLAGEERASELLESVSRGEPFVLPALRVERADGLLLRASLRAFPLEDRGEVAGAVLSLHELPAERPEEELELELERERQARASAEEKARGRDELLAAVSHELRTPLTAVLGWSGLLRAGLADEATRKQAAAAIERSARTQARLVEDLLETSRARRGEVRLDVGPVDLGALVREAMETVQPSATDKGIRLEARIDDAATAIEGDARRLQQVLVNLLSNAIKFGRPGGRAFVELARAPDEHVELSVSDDGRGIDPDFVPFVFDKFRQGEGAGGLGGLGLGLAIVRHLAELHGGRVAAESEGEDRGATFRVVLPVTPSARPARPAADADRATAAG